MNHPKVPLLGYALLGLLQQKPSSGYGLRKMFATSPMGTFSDSPGAIYPALRRLEMAGQIRGEVEDGSGLRRKKVFRLTAAGTVTFKRWLNTPVGREDVVRGVDELMLRFSFMDQAIGAPEVVRFLKALLRELNAYIPSLREYLSSHQGGMPRSGRLALESGIRGYETLLQWSRYAIACYEDKTKGGKES